MIWIELGDVKRVDHRHTDAVLYRTVNARLHDGQCLTIWGQVTWQARIG